MITLHQQYTFFVYPQEIDGSAQLRLSSLEGYLLNAAGLAAEDNGFGAMEMIQQGVTWVLSQLSIEMQRLPKQYESFVIETWVEDYGRLLTTRHFIVYDKDKQEIGSACSQWALIDIKSRRPINLQTREDLMHFATGEPGKIEKPLRIGAVNDGVEVARHKVSYSDIDYNMHLTNTRYPNLICDMLPSLEGKRISEFSISFVNQAELGEELTFLEGESDGAYYIRSLRTDGKVNIEARVKLENI